MDFTREPIIETVVTPRDGHRIVVRSSKNPGQEEFIVDALEVVSFSHAHFFRSLERPRAFLLPVSDYEILEIREPRLPLKAATLESATKKEVPRPAPQPKEPAAIKEAPVEEPVAEDQPQEGRSDRRRDKRRAARRRRGREEGSRPEAESVPAEAVTPPPKETVAPGITSILPPPSTLIRDDLQRLRQSEQYKGAFYSREGQNKEEDDEAPVAPLQIEEIHQDENAYKASPQEDDPQPWLGKVTAANPSREE